MVGFALVFVGLSFVITAHYMDSSSAFLVRCKLWEYYWVEIPRAFQRPNLGPLSDSSGLGSMLLPHI